MNIVIVGLGLIGASLAKAFKEYTSHHIIGIDEDLNVLDDAIGFNVIDKAGDSKDLNNADIIYLCIYPKEAIKFIENNLEFISSDCIVTDTCGIKSLICNELKKLSKNRFEFVGSHPMAGKEKNGFYESDGDLFQNASYIIVPGDASEKSINIVEKLALSIGFKKIQFASAEEHDKMIAFTSQIPHILACAYVLSPKNKKHYGFSAGSYRDVSRVANINEILWTELFISNKGPLTVELELLIDNLTKIKYWIDNEDTENLKKVLKQGKIAKEEADN